MSFPASGRTGLPPAAGVSLKPEHFRQALEGAPALGFFEIHAGRAHAPLPGAGVRAAAFSEHLAWPSLGGTFFNDLLPLPYDQCTL